MHTYSVVIPVYNIEKYIRECIESVISQTFKPMEIILVDDGSDDQSGQICEEYKNRHGLPMDIIVIHQNHSGPSQARNQGIRAASGDYIFFLDGDDIIENCALESFESVLEEYGELDVIQGRSRYFVEDDEYYHVVSSFISNSWAAGKTGQEVFAESYRRNKPVAMGAGGLYNRKFLTVNHLYQRQELNYGED